ncbi:hypothetical protein KO361_05605 [Candidatus Woesearchaeota archaeon]|nr:hypothetical protein [Candidatus Woesearchaeota archaeon]
MNKFCPKCGISISKGVFCNDCDPVTLEFKPINIKLCPSGKYFFKGKWSFFDDLRKVSELVVSKSLKKKVRVLKGLDEYDDIIGKTGMKKDFDVVVLVDDNEFVIPVSVEITSSPGFSKVGSNYFEGILQLRNADKSVKIFVNNLIDSMSEVYVNKIIDKKDSVDYYFVSKKFLGRVAEKIVEEYGAFMDSNAQLFTQDKISSKELFRVNVVVHIPPFKKFDVVVFIDDLIFINNLGKFNRCINLRTGKKFSLKYNPVDFHKYEILKKQKTSVISTHPVSVLSKNSYEVVEVLNPLNIVVGKDDSVFLVEHEGVAYLVK